jgi:hypothetical protein
LIDARANPNDPAASSTGSSDLIRAADAYGTGDINKDPNPEVANGGRQLSLAEAWTALLAEAGQSPALARQLLE